MRNENVQIILWSIKNVMLQNVMLQNVMLQNVMLHNVMLQNVTTKLHPCNCSNVDNSLHVSIMQLECCSNLSNGWKSDIRLTKSTFDGSKVANNRNRIHACKFFSNNDHSWRNMLKHWITKQLHTVHLRVWSAFVVLQTDLVYSWSQRCRGSKWIRHDTCEFSVNCYAMNR